MDTLNTINTIIIDLFHPNPEDLGAEGAEHDILATSESGVNFALYFKKAYRLYYCEDLEHETSILEWHCNDGISQKNNLSFFDAQSLQDILATIKQELKGPVRLILNGQGNLASNPSEQDTIAGYNSEEFIEIVDNFINLFNLKSKECSLFELVISSCNMANSIDFVQALTNKYSDFIHSLEIILFKEMITFSRSGEFTSFFKKGGFKTDTFNLFSAETTLSIFCPPVLKVTEKENLSPPSSPVKAVLNPTPKPLLQHPQYFINLKRAGEDKDKSEQPATKKAKIDLTVTSTPIQKNKGF